MYMQNEKSNNKEQISIVEYNYKLQQALITLFLWGAPAGFLEYVQENAYNRPNVFYQLSESMGHQNSLAGAAVFGAGEHILDFLAESFFPENEKLRKIIPWVLFTIATIYNLAQLIEPQYADNAAADIFWSGTAIGISRLIRKVFSGIYKRKTEQ